MNECQQGGKALGVLQPTRLEEDTYWGVRLNTRTVGSLQSLLKASQPEQTPKRYP